MDPQKEFERRTYGSLGELLSDQTRNLRSMRRLGRDRRWGLITAGFQRRLMLAHTHVNRCRYCSWAHARGALRAGVPQGQVEDLLCGAVDGCPPDETAALVYAVHFAGTDGHPDSEAREALVEEYGPERAEAIERTLRAIRSGNLLGNSFDYLLWRLSGGRLGNKERLGVGGAGQDPAKA